MATTKILSNLAYSNFLFRQLKKQNSFLVRDNK